MSVSTTIIFKEYITGLGQTAFPFTGLAYLSTTASTVLKVYVDDVLQGGGFGFTEGSAVDGVATTGTLTFSVPPGFGTTVKIQRETALTQPTLFGNDYNKETVRESVDRLLLQMQEVEAEIDGITPTPCDCPGNAIIADYAIITDYVEDEHVYYPPAETGIYPTLYRSTDIFTSADFQAELAAGQWEPVLIQGLKGNAGETGATGDVGLTGDTGAAGAAGADGIFTEVANQTEAIAGINNVKGMTPLRVKEAIAAQVPALTAITDIEDSVTDVEDDIVAITIEQSTQNTRLDTLESAVLPSIYMGSQLLLNAQAVPVALDALGAGSNGVPLKVWAAGTWLVRFTMQISRVADGVERFEQKNFALHYIDGTWYLGIEQELVLSGSLAGVTLSVVTSGTAGEEAGQVYYVSDDFPGTVISATIKWTGKEIPTSL